MASLFVIKQNRNRECDLHGYILTGKSACAKIGIIFFLPKTLDKTVEPVVLVRMNFIQQLVKRIKSLF